MSSFHFFIDFFRIKFHASVCFVIQEYYIMYIFLEIEGNNYELKENYQ